MGSTEVELIYKWANSDARAFWHGREVSLEEIKEDWKPHYFSDKDPLSGRCFAIEVEGKKIGTVNYNQIDKENKNVELDIVIGDKQHWGKGYGSDALKTLLKYLFKRFKLNRIWIAPYAFNKRAIRSYEKVGFKREGILRKDAFIEGRFVDSIMMSILRKEHVKEIGN